MRRTRYDEQENNRIDARNQADPAVQVGMRNIRRGMSGRVEGGITAEGRRLGTAKLSSDTSSRQAWRGTGAPAVVNQPATGNILNGRQNLFKEMTAAGSAGLTPEMRSKARALGVTDEQFNAAAGKLQANEAVTPARPSLAATTPPAPLATTAAAPAQAPAPVSKINGMPAAQAIAGARVGAERAWAGKAPKAPSNALARAAAPVPANSPTPAPQSSWRGATAPVAPVSGTKPTPKPMDDLIASIDKARAGNRALLDRPAPGSTPDFRVPPVANAQPIGTPAPAAPATAPAKPQGITRTAAPAAVMAPPANTPRMVDPVQRGQAQQAQWNAQAASANAAEKAAIEKRKAGVPDLVPSLGSDSGINKLWRGVVGRYTR